jgi:hypothetical protein
MARKSAKSAKRVAGADATWFATPQERRQTEREFSRALKTGSLIHSSGARIRKTDPKVLEALIEQARRNTTRAISIRVPIPDLERAHEIAAAKGVGYQTVLKTAIREGLKRAG